MNALYDTCECVMAHTKGMTALHVAAREGHDEIVRFLSNTPDFYRPDLDLPTAGVYTCVLEYVCAYIYGCMCI